jgi:ankyrin repeat protein
MGQLLIRHLKMDCCCIQSNSQPPLHNLVKYAIEIGDIDYFSRNKNSSDIINAMSYSVEILDYIIKHNQTSLFFYLVREDDYWAKKTKCLLEMNSLKYIFLAIKKENLEITSYLISLLKENKRSLADPKLGTKNLLHYFAKASFQTYKALYELLVQHPEMKGKDVLVDEKGNTLLHQAAEARNFGFFRYLIEEQHQSPLIRNKEGKTALDKIKQFMFTRSSKKYLREYRKEWKLRHRRMLAFLSCKQEKYQNIDGNSVQKLPKYLIERIFDYIPSVSKNKP